jgi:hypothetical protein
MRHVVLTLLIAGCGHPDDPPAPAPPPPPAPAPAPVVRPAAVKDPGSCTLEVTGALSTKETMAAGPALASKYWRPDEEHLPPLTINCIGKDVRLSFVASPNGAVPYGPKSYAIAASRGDLVVLGRAGKPLSDFAGTIEVTAFDATHVAGTFALGAKQTGGGAVKLSGSFELRR